MDIVTYNSNAWDGQAERGNRWTIPVSREEVKEARQGNWALLLTPVKPVPRKWFGDVRNKKILCLASGGGQQGPILAAAGAEVTVFDNSAAQLARDTAAAERDNLAIKTEQGNMADLSRFLDLSFDLIFHPVSNCFAENILPVWKECFRILRDGGVLLAGFVNPLMYMDEGILTVCNSIPYADTDQLSKEDIVKRTADNEPLEFGHSLEDQIGGQLHAGFLLSDCYEDTSGGGPLDPFIPCFMATRAVKYSPVQSGI